MGERVRKAWKSGSPTRQGLAGLVWSMVAISCAILARGLRGLAAAFEAVGRVIRTGAGRLQRAVDEARARATRALTGERSAAAPGPVPADKTIVMPAADKTIVAPPAFLAALPPALPLPPRPQWGRGPLLPPPRRGEWRSALEAKRPSGAVPQELSPPADTTDARSDG